MLSNPIVALTDRLYRTFARLAGYLQSPFLLAIRLYWGWQFLTTGWGKLQNIPKVVGFFTDLGIPAPTLNAYMVATTETVGGLLLILGLGARAAAVPLAISMVVAYLTADLEAVKAIFSNPDDFVKAAPFPFLMTSTIVLVYGPGAFSADRLIDRVFARRPAQGGAEGKGAPEPAAEAGARGD